MEGVTFQSNYDVILRQIRSNNAEASRQAIELAVENVQWMMLYGYHDVHGLPDNPHTEIVDTGNLFDSIRGEMKRVSSNAYTVEVGSDMPYARYVHEGTHNADGSVRLAARHYITDGLSRAAPELERIIGNVWRRGMSQGLANAAGAE